MKLHIFKSALAAAAVTLGVAGLTGCQDHFDEWVLDAPVADIEANISILEFKQLFWDSSSTSYCVEIPEREDGSHYIIRGRVISSDEQSNVFKCLYIQDETAAMPISINQYSLYVNYRIGQEILVDLTGLYCGKYAGQFQIGALQYDEKTGNPETTFLDPEFFAVHRQLNGYPEPEKIDTIVVESIDDMNSDPMVWQGQLVRYNNATFTNGNNPDDDLLCNEYHSSGYNQAFTGSFGTDNLYTRTSGYSTFWNTKLPAEACDLVGIQGYYLSSPTGTAAWQLILNSASGIMNVGNPTASGTQNKPYTVEEAIELSTTGSTTAAWVEGYIVGTIQPEITTISSNSDIQWIGSAPYIVDNYLVIASSPEVRDYTQCMLIPIAANSSLYTYGNLADNPDNAGRVLKIRGRFATSMGMAALTNNDGSTSTFEIEGVDIPDDGSGSSSATSGDGTQSSPYSVAQVIALNSPGTTAWVKGYIVGAMNSNNDYTFEVTAPFGIASNVYIADSASETDTSNMVPVQLVSGTSIRSAVNLMDNPGNIGKVLSIEGTLSAYFSQPGVKAPTDYSLDGSGSGSSSGDSGSSSGSATDGSGTQSSPYSVAQAIALNNPGTTAWVKGYIVGAMNSNNNYTFEYSAPFGIASNVYIADSASETNTDNMLPVQLVSGTSIRSAVNLIDNPDNLGKVLSIEGTLSAYFSQPGLKAPTDYSLDGSGSSDSGSSSGSGSDSGTTTGGGTESDPYTVAQAIALNNPGTTAWVKGYIVGAMNATNNYTFEVTAPFAVASNVYLADSASETNTDNMLPVQLVSGTAIRSAVNLIDNPDNLGKLLSIEGTLTAYFSQPGLKAPTAYSL